MRVIRSRIKKATSTRRGKIIGLSLLIILLGGIGGAVWYWRTHKNEIIRGKIEEAISKGNGFYKVSYDTLQLDELTGWLSVTNMKLQYDSAKYEEMARNGDAPSALVSVTVPEITVSGVKTPRALINNEIVGRKLEIKNPVIDIAYTNRGKDSLRNVPTNEIYRQLLGNLDLIKLDSIVISGAKLTTSSHKTGKKMIELDDLAISMLDVQVDSASNADTTRLLFAKKLGLQCGLLKWAATNKLYNYRAENISMNSDTTDLTIASFAMMPTMGEDQFVNAIPTQDDRFDFIFRNIALRNIHLGDLMDERLVADRMTIGSSNFKVYRDLIRPRDTKNRVGLYPHQVISRIPILFNIKNVQLNNSFIEYKERNNITRRSGKIQFYNVSATFSNFTNSRKDIAKNNIMRMNMTSRFLNLTPFNAKMTFHLLDKEGRFELSGNIGALDATLLNPVTEPMGPASIRKGFIDSGEFDFTGDNLALDGTIRLLYHDLKMDVLDRKAYVTGEDKKHLVSFLANIIIKNDNPKKGDDVRVVTVHQERDTNHSIFYLCWKSLFKGIRETVGIKK